MKKLRNIHPGEILKLDFLEELNITTQALSKAIKVNQTKINQLIKGTSNMSADLAIRLEKYFKVSAKFWLSIQNDFNLEEELRNKKRYQKIKPYLGNRQNADG